MFLPFRNRTWTTGARPALRCLRRPWPHLALLLLLPLASACGRDSDSWLSRAWAPVRDALPLGASALALPAEWTPAAEDDSAVALADVAPLGAWQPFVAPKAQAIWQQWRDGEFAAAAKAAEALDPKQLGNREAQLRWTLFLVTTRRYLALTDSEHSKDWQQKAREALRAGAAYPPLRQSILEELALEADKAGQSNAVLGLLPKGPTTQSAILRARALRRNQELAAALEELDSKVLPVDTAMDRQRLLELARIHEAQGDAAQVRDLLQQILRAGKSAEADETVHWLIGDKDEVWQKRLQTRADDGPMVLDALVYAAQRRRYARVVPALQALATSKVAAAVACHARSWWGKSLDRQAKFEESAALYAAWPASCDTPDVRALAVDEDPLPAGDVAFRRGRALAILGKAEAAAALRLALDSKLGGLDGEDAATLAELLKDDAAAKLVAEHGVVAAKDYAERDIVDVIGWRVAQAWLHDGQLDRALKLLQRLAEVRDRSPMPGANAPAPDDFRWDERDWARGRADYFAGRVLDQQGKTDAAVALWSRVVSRHPLSYYATLAVSRLQAMGRPLPQTDTIDGIQPQNPNVFVDQTTAQARLLGLLGWHTAANALLDRIGLPRDLPEGRRYEAGDPLGVWTRAMIDDEAGRWTASHAIGRDVSKRYWLRAPTDANRKAWEVAYPRGFRKLMDAAAKEAGIDPAIVYAICRSESGFNARVESHAAAIGLLQLILPTAEAMAKPLGLEATAQTLREPAVNTRLGARYLGKLLERFERESQMAAGYNAGGGAVGRWRKQRGEWPLDLFVEMIPFRETRDYAKRVQSAIAVYQTLYGGVATPRFRLDQKPVPAAEEPATEPGKPRTAGPAQALPKLGAGSGASGAAAARPTPAEPTPPAKPDAAANGARPPKPAPAPPAKRPAPAKPKPAVKPKSTVKPKPTVTPKPAPKPKPRR